MKSNEKYLYKALDYYPYSLEETSEALDYALSYDDQNTDALCLYGRLYAEQLQKFETAKSYFEKTLMVDINHIAVYPYYIETLIQNEDFDQAEKLIAFALNVKGIDKVAILFKKALLLEIKKEFKNAKKVLEEITLEITCDCCASKVETIEKRIKNKMKIISKTKSKKKKGSK